MPVIALSIEPHALDRTFAEVLTKSLGLEVIDLRDFERRLAWNCGAEDVQPSALPKQIRRYSNPGMDWPMTSRQLATRIHELVLETAAEGNVAVLSWSASAVLRPMHHVARVLVRASTAYRAATVQHELAYTHLETACMEIASEDTAIHGFVESTFNSDWQDPNAFSLVINSECMSVRQTIALIATLMTCPRFRDDQRARAEIALRLRKLHVEEEQNASCFASSTKSGPKQTLFRFPMVS